MTHNRAQIEVLNNNHGKNGVSEEEPPVDIPKYQQN